MAERKSLLSVKDEKMSDTEFHKFSKFIYQELGIYMSEIKKVMLTSRLSRRLVACDLFTFKEYYDYLQTPTGREKELNEFINAVTTNKTDFFREKEHFDALQNIVLPQIIEEKKKTADRKITVWSAASSTGEEPYTLAMVLDRALQNTGFDYQIIASDISLDVLHKAVQAEYNKAAIQPIPESYRKQYLLRGKNKKNGIFKIAPDLRHKVEYRQLNLVEFEYKLPKNLDIVFCRNVFIYFNKETQKEIFQNMQSYIRQGGYFFLGHSETIDRDYKKIRQVKPTIYQCF